MTKNEAKYYLLEHKPIIGFKTHNEALDMAIQALEEIQQYRAIGTVEEIQSIKDQLLMVKDMCKDYYEIGTIDEFKALKEKSVAKKPLRIPDDDTCIYYGYYCPCCNEPLSNTARIKRCFCGQALDWSE